MIAGPVGSMGQRALQPIINQQVGNVLAAIDAEVQTAKAAPASDGWLNSPEPLPCVLGGDEVPLPLEALQRLAERDDRLGGLSAEQQHLGQRVVDLAFAVDVVRRLCDGKRSRISAPAAA